MAKILIFLLALSQFALAKEINILLPAKNISLDPGGVIDQSSLWVNRQVHCQLFRQEGRNVVNDAAAAYKYESPTRLVVELRKDLTFSNGEKVKPIDVVNSIETLKKKRKVLRNVFRWIKSVEVMGENKIIFNLKSAVPQFQKFLTSPHYSILSKEFLSKVEKDNSLWDNPNGCGKFKIKDRSSLFIVLYPKNGHGNSVKFWFRDSIADKKLDDFDIIPAINVTQNIPSEKFRVEKIFDPYQLMLALNTNSEIFKNKKDRCEFLSSLDTHDLRLNLGSEYSEAKSIFPRGIIGFNENQDWSSYYKSHTQGKKINTLKVSFLNVSIPPTLQPTYEKWLQASAERILTKAIESPKNFGEDFSHSDSNLLVFGLKSNYLDGYEYLLVMSEDSANATGLKNEKLKKSIVESQDINDTFKRAQSYEVIADEVKKMCVIFPIVTISYKKLFIKSGIETPGLGQAPLNDYDLSRVQ